MSEARRVLVWQWGRRGAGPHIAAALAAGMRAIPGLQVALSLSRQAEILTAEVPPACEYPVDTYDGLKGFIIRLLTAPLSRSRLTRRLRASAPELAICAMPGPLDFVMAAAVRHAGGKVMVIVHDADAHPGDGFPFQMWLQRRLCRGADVIATLSSHVEARLREQGFGRVPILQTTLPPMHYGVAAPQAHDGPIRLLHFGRLLPYKGLDLLAEALTIIGPRRDLLVRIAGSGPASAELDALAALPNVTVENRWVPEEEVGALLGWSDALILPYREASQSGVAAAALAAGRAVVATRVGGLTEQLSGTDRAFLCEPTAMGLADAIRALLDHPPPPVAIETDPVAPWRDMGADLLRQMSAAGR